GRRCTTPRAWCCPTMRVARPAKRGRLPTSCLLNCGDSHTRRRSRQMLGEATRRRRASSIAEVVDIMTTLDRELNDTDGLWWFNRLYLRVTLAVRGAVTTATFRDPSFLERLDVEFANLYFDAVAAGDVDSRAAPSAWRPLFESRHRRDLKSVQFALAGMNAHINRDLPAGVVAAYVAPDGAPG